MLESPPAASERQNTAIALRHSLTVRQASITIVIVLVLGLLIGLIELYADWRAMRTAIVQQAKSTLNLVEGSAQEALFQFNDVLADQVVQSLLDTGQVRQVILRDDFGSVFAAGERDNVIDSGRLIQALFGDLAEYTIALRHQSTPGLPYQEVGQLAITLAMNNVAGGFVARSLISLALGMVRALLISALVVLIFYLMITRPLLTLHNRITGIDPNHPGDWPRPKLRGHDHDELGQIIHSLDQLMQAFQHTMAQRDQAHAENARLGAELQVSQRIQRILLPSQAELDTIASLEIAPYMEPADEIGGDYYDVLPHEHGIRIGIGDVTGHGLESGVVMLMAQCAVRTLLNTQESNIARTMQAINATIYGSGQRMDSGKNLSLTLIDYHSVADSAPSTSNAPAVCGELRVYGQHETLIIVRHDGHLEICDTDELGFPIGLVDDVSPFINELRISLYAGDTVVLYTDGVTEAANTAHELYGESRLVQVIQHHHQAPAAVIRDHIVNDIKQYIGTQKVYDDITLLVFKQR